MRRLAGTFLRAAIARGRARRAVLALGVVALVAAAAAPAAQALPPMPGPLGPITTALGIGGSQIGGQAAVGAFEAIIGHLFAPVARFVNVQLLGWLISVPNFATGNVRELQATVCAMGAAALGAVATVAVARYWLAGLAGGGASGFEALEGLARTVGAAMFLVLWPWLFDTGVELANLFARSLMGAGSVTDDSARLLAVGLGAAAALNGSSVGSFLMIVIAVLASLLFLGLLLVKLVLSVSTVLVFVAMPIAVVLWPLPACAWLARICVRAFAVCLLVPACWALCFAATSAVGVDALGFRGGTGGVPNALLEPLVAITLMYVTLVLPRTLARVAMLGGGLASGGVVSRAVGYAAGRTLAGAVAQHTPVSIGGRHGSSGSGQRSRGGPAAACTSSAGTGSSVRASAASGPASATSRTSTSERTTPSGEHSATSSAASRGTADAPNHSGAGGQARSEAYVPPAAGAAADGGGDGLQTPGFHGREHHHALELLAAESRAASRPVSSEDAAKALRTLPADTRRGVAGLAREHGAGAREHLAYQTLGDWTGEQREALRTLAAATPDVRERAVAEVLAPTPERPAAPASSPPSEPSQLSGTSGPPSAAPEAGGDELAPAPRPLGEVPESPEERS